MENDGEIRSILVIDDEPAFTLTLSDVFRRDSERNSVINARHGGTSTAPAQVRSRHRRRRR
jgi:hypothetical protein